MQVKLKLFFKWGIKFGDPYTVSDMGNRKVEYAGKDNVQDEIYKKYHSDPVDEGTDIPGAPDSEMPSSGGQKQYENNNPPKSKSNKNGGSNVRTSPNQTHSVQTGGR